jgi:hypothetical protein
MPANVALAVRAGEHACCRCAVAEDRARLTAAFIGAGLARGHKVVYLCPGDDLESTAADVTAEIPEAGPALASGQLEVQDAELAYTPDGCFDLERMLASAHEHLRRALREGYPALAVTGDMSWALGEAPGCERLGEYERRLGEVMDGESIMVLCQYDHGRFASGVLSDMATVHAVDVSPELASIGGVRYLAAARADAGRTLRLAGELDFVCADALGSVLDGHFGGDLHLDLADLEFVDVAGMRALRGSRGRHLTIDGASEAVRQILALLAWDTDPAIELRETSA